MAETLPPHERQANKVRALVDFIMGGLLFSAGLVLLYIYLTNRPLFTMYPSMRSLLLGLLFLIYGSIRIYRGARRTKIKDEAPV